MEYTQETGNRIQKSEFRSRNSEVGEARGDVKRNPGCAAACAG